MPKNPYNLTPATLKGQRPMLTGDVIFVDTATGNSSGDGTSLRPYDKIASAIARSGLSSGDTIYLMQGHTETISTATALSLSVAGVNIIGLGYASQRPTITLDTATTATINVTAANVRLENCIIVANFADIVAAFTLTNAPGFTLVDVECRDTSSVLNFLNIIDTDTTTNHAADLSLVRVRRLGAGATTATTIIKMDGTNARLRCTDCYFAHKNVDDGGLFMLIATGKVVTDMEVNGCKMNFVGVSSAAAGVLITTDGSTNSGYIANTYVKHLDATSEIMVTASSGFVFWDLKATAVADKQGYLVPAADA